MLLKAYKKVEKLVHNNSSITEGMMKLIKFCEQTRPADCWKPFYALPYDDDFSRLSCWLEKLLTEEPPKKKINGLWFGLFNPILDDGKPTSCLYLAGSTQFDPESDDPDWACSPEYCPAGRYSNSAVLTALYRATSATGGDAGMLGEYTLCLGFSSLVVAAWCRGPLRSKLNGRAPFRGITVGFDSGDDILVDILRG